MSAEQRAKPSRRARLLTTGIATLFATGIALWVWHATSSPLGSSEITEVDSDVDEDAESWRDYPGYVVDPVAGHRPRAGVTKRLSMAALNDLKSVEIEKRRCRSGFLRSSELPTELEHPSVLFLGDSHLEGVVSTADNLSSRLEAELTATGTPCYALNAGCGMSSLWYYPLRARTLLPQYRPRVTVVVVYLGNDLVELEDPREPYLDDSLNEQPGDPGAAPRNDPTAYRELSNDLLPGLFWQGLQQADWFVRNPERWPVVRDKAAHAIDELERSTRAHGSELIWVLLPSLDLLLPDRLAGIGPRAVATATAGIQRRIHDDLLALLEEREAEVVDLLPEWSQLGQDVLAYYAVDCHVFIEGHRRIAELLTPRLREHLRD